MIAILSLNKELSNKAKNMLVELGLKNDPNNIVLFHVDATETRWASQMNEKLEAGAICNFDILKSTNPPHQRPFKRYVKLAKEKGYFIHDDRILLLYEAIKKAGIKIKFVFVKEDAITDYEKSLFELQETITKDSFYFNVKTTKAELAKYVGLSD